MSQQIHELHLFQHELLDTFVIKFFDAIDAMLGVNLEFHQGATSYGQDFNPPFPCIVQLDYTGSSVGFLALAANASVYELVMGDGWKRDCYGILKEAINTVSGHLLEMLKQVCPVVTLLSPKIIEGKVEYAKASCLSRIVHTCHGDLYFGVVIDQRALDIDIVLKETVRVKERLQQTQEELVQAEKMASLGELVAGVAHEVNTPLGVGVTGISHLSEQVSLISQKFREGKMKRSELYVFLKNCEEEVRLIYGNLMRASRLVQSFKKVAADQSSEDTRLFALVPYIREVVSSMEHLLREQQISIYVEGDNRLVIFSYPGVYSQIVTHLLGNALRHGFEGKDSGSVIVSIHSDNRDVTMSFKDNGIGMKSETRHKVFDPFFTTKRGSGGSTGLGLHIIYNIIAQRLGGNIKCFSEEGQGSEFVITCPLECPGVKSTALRQH